MHNNGSCSANAMSSLGSDETNPKKNVFIAIANDDGGTVAELATDDLMSRTVRVERTPDPIYTFAGLGMLACHGEKYQGLTLREGQTLLQIAEINGKRAAMGALENAVSAAVHSAEAPSVATAAAGLGEGS